MIGQVPLPELPLPLPGVGDVAGDFAGDFIGRAFDYITKDFIGPSIGEVTDGLIDFMLNSSSVDLTGDFAGMGDVRAVVLGLSALTMLAILFLGVIKAVLSGQPAAVVRQAFLDIPRQGFITAAYLSVAQVAIVVVDGVSAEVLGGVGEGIGQLGEAVNTTGGPTVILPVIFMVLYILAAIFVWAELLIRSAMIYIIAVLAPLGYAAGASPSGRDLSRRTSMAFAAIILSKLGIAIAFRVGAGLINGVGEGGEWSASEAMVGVTTMGLAAFMPFMILKAIPVMESATIAEGAERAPLRAAGTAAGIGLGVGFAATNLASLAGGGASATGALSAGAAAGGGSGAGLGGAGGGPPPPRGGGGSGGGGPALGQGPIVSGPGGEPSPPAGLGAGSAGALPRGPLIAGAGQGGAPAHFAAPASGGGVDVIPLELGSDGRFRMPAEQPPPTQAGLAGTSGSRPVPQLGAGNLT